MPVRHPGRWACAAVLVVLAAMVLHAGLTTPALRWDIVGHYLFDRSILDGLTLTVELTVLAMLVGVVLGTVLAVLRLSPNPVMRTFSWIYIWFFRGTPVIVQLLFWYFLAAVMPVISFGVPFGPSFTSYSTNHLISQFTAALLGLGLNQAAYSAEIVRAGILSVDEGQSRAASALGYTRLATMRRIVLPQAMRIIIPPLGNEVISMLKTTALVLVIALPDLLTSAQLIYNRNFAQIPLLIVASIWYLAVTSVLSVLQRGVERRFGRGF